MSEDLLPCPFCGKDCHKTTLCMHNETLVECNNPKCALFGRIMKTSTWNTRPDSKPYKWADGYGWINAHLTMYKGDNASDCMLSAFNAGRERKDG